MGRHCSICSHPLVREIDRLLVDPNRSYRTVEEAFPGTNAKSLERHHKGHLLPRMEKVAGVDREGVEATVGLLGQMEELRERAMGLLDKAEKAGSLPNAIKAIREVRGVLDSQARITGEGTRAGTVINIINAPAWITVQTTIMAALEAHPNARDAVVTALGAIEHE